MPDSITPKDLRAAVNTVTASVLCGADLIVLAITHLAVFAVAGVLLAVLMLISFRGIGRA